MFVRALYVLKSTGAAFRSHIARCMESMGYQSCKAHLDLWLKPEIIPEDGINYYSYILYYVGDILCIHHNADSVLEQLHKSFPLIPGFGKPNIYLGTAKDQVTQWCMGMSNKFH